MLTLLLFTLAFAEEKTAFEKALEHQQLVNTEERTVTVNGLKYREVVYEGKSYYLRYLGPDQPLSELDCALSAPSLPHLDESAIKVRRAKVFVSALKEACEARNGQVKHDVALDPRVGVEFPEGKDDAIKKKKVYVSPLNHGLGFSGEW